ncbi:MAG: TonB-dependent receptor [bacterium]|nr:TonB-dependent receptor [bacterium]
MFRLLLHIFAIASIAYASPGGGSVSGTVTDDRSGAPLEGALVSLEGTAKSAITGESGYFVIRDVPNGSYAVKVSLIGYSENTVTKVDVESGGRVTVRISLDITVVEGAVHIEAEQSDYSSDRPDIAVSDYILSQDEIYYQPSGSNDINRALQALPGVSFPTDYDSELVVRGGSPDENLTLLDDIEIYSAGHFADEFGGGGVISAFNLNAVENVEFVAGGFPVEYGGKRSSVLKLNLKEGPIGGFTGSAYADAAGYGATIAGPLGSPGSAKGTYLAAGRVSLIELISAITDSVPDTEIPKYWDTNVKAAYRLKTNHKLSVIGFYSTDRLNAERESEKNDGRSWYSRMDAEGITHEWTPSNRTALNTTFYHTAYLWEYLSDKEGESSFAGYEELSIKNRTAYRFDPRFELVIGGSSSAFFTDYEYSKEATISLDGIVAPIRYGGAVNSYRLATFGEGIVKPFGPVTLTLGCRVDYSGFNNDINISPRACAGVEMTDKITLNAALGRFYQPPNPIELIGSKYDENDGLIYAGYADHYILGVTYSLAPGFEVGMEGYYKLFGDLPVELIRDTRIYLFNVGEGDALGCEWSIQKKHTDKYFARSSYALSKSVRKSGIGGYDYPSDFDQTHIFNVVSGYEIIPGVTISARYRYATGRPYSRVIGRVYVPAYDITADIEGYYGIYGTKNSARYPGYQRLDVRLDKTFDFAGWSLRIYLDCLNVTNHMNVSHYSWNDDYTERATKKTFGFLPLFGGEASLK